MTGPVSDSEERNKMKAAFAQEMEVVMEEVSDLVGGNWKKRHAQQLHNGYFY